MQDEQVDRRSFLKVMGAMSMSSLHPLSGHVVEQVAGTGAPTKAKDSIKFGVVGLDHYHIMGMTPGHLCLRIDLLKIGNGFGQVGREADQLAAAADAQKNAKVLTFTN